MMVIMFFKSIAKADETISNSDFFQWLCKDDFQKSQNPVSVLFA